MRKTFFTILSILILFLVPIYTLGQSPNNIKTSTSPTFQNPDKKDGSGTLSSGPEDNSAYDLVIENPINAETFGELFTAIYKRLFALILPLAVIVIVYAGILFTTASYDVKQVDKAKEYLKYAILALVIIFIGRGFITLLNSILNFLFK